MIHLYRVNVSDVDRDTVYVRVFRERCKLGKLPVGKITRPDVREESMSGILRKGASPLPEFALRLARRTIESRPSALNDALDAAVAAGPHASLAGAIVSGKHFLEIAEFAIGLSMIA
jgi:hypothetical protein